MQRVKRLHYTAEHPLGLQFIFLTHPASAWPFSPPFSRTLSSLYNHISTLPSHGAAGRSFHIFITHLSTFLFYPPRRFLLPPTPSLVATQAGPWSIFGPVDD